MMEKIHPQYRELDLSQSDVPREVLAAEPQPLPQHLIGLPAEPFKGGPLVELNWCTEKQKMHQYLKGNTY